MDGHCDECRVNAAMVRDAINDYKARWPDHCRACSGAGYFAYDEDVAGDGGSRMQMSEPCDVCSGQLKCARCMRENLQWDNLPHDAKWVCIYCGWDDTKQ